MKKRQTAAILALVVALAGGGILACGGGGGGGGAGDDGGGTTPGLTYTGSTRAALITADNAVPLAANAIKVGESGAALTGIAAVQDTPPPATAAGRPFTVALSRSLHGVVGQMMVAGPPQAFQPAAVQSESDTINGECGGTAAYEIDVDRQTGLFSGTLTFNDYCDAGVTLDGQCRFSGAMDMAVGEIVSFTLVFDVINGVSGTESVTMDGEIAMLLGDPAVAITLNLLLREDVTGWVSKLSNYRLELMDLGSHVEVTIRGRFYDPDYGYVNLSTPVPLRLEIDDDYPSAGSVIAVGETGRAGGPTQARLTALSATQCRVVADTDGDGLYDYDSGDIDWIDLW